MKHTPGPWIVCKNLTDVYAPDTDTAITNSSHPCYPDEYEAIANAALIAAAPELLEAAQRALFLIKDTWIVEHGNEQVGEAWGALERAIAKARGE